MMLIYTGKYIRYQLTRSCCPVMVDYGVPVATHHTISGLLVAPVQQGSARRQAAITRRIQAGAGDELPAMRCGV
jgi:hypothetical protein